MKLTVAATLQAPAEAREFISSSIAAATLPAGVLPEDFVLAVSELVTNSVDAGATSIEVEIHLSARRVDLTVNDDADGWPVQAIAADHHQRGRGLAIVQRLADRWSVHPRQQGKSVTATWFGRLGQTAT